MILTETMCLLQIQPLAPITSVTPSSIFAWGGFIFGLIAVLVLIYDRMTGRGRSLVSIDSSINGLCTSVDQLKAAQSVEQEEVEEVVQSLRDFLIEWRGLDGTNGFKALIRANTKMIEEIISRNTKIDAVRAHDQKMSGGKHRRVMDKVLDEENANKETE